MEPKLSHVTHIKMPTVNPTLRRIINATRAFNAKGATTPRRPQRIGSDSLLFQKTTLTLEIRCVYHMNISQLMKLLLFPNPVNPTPQFRFQYEIESRFLTVHVHSQIKAQQDFSQGKKTSSLYLPAQSSCVPPQFRSQKPPDVNSTAPFLAT